MSKINLSGHAIGKILVVVLVPLLMASSCGGGGGGQIPPAPAQNTPQPAIAGVAGEDVYTGSQNTYGDCTVDFGLGSVDDPGIIQGDQDDLSNALRGSGWAVNYTPRGETLNDSTVQTASQNQDSLFAYFGHGFPGLMIFDQLRRWGVGTASGQVDCNKGIEPPDIVSVPPDRGSMPIQGSLHWLLAFSSDTAAGPSTVDSCPGKINWDSDWRPAFSTSGSLHGLYGFWEQPLALCLNQHDRSEDINIKAVGPIALQFEKLATNQLTPLSVHDAFAEASEDVNGGSARFKWAIWEDTNARKEALTNNSSALRPPSGIVDFYDEEILSGASPKTTMTQDSALATITPQAITFSLQPLNIANEPIDDASQFSAIQNNIDSNAGYVDDGLSRSAYDAAAVVSHYYDGSGAVLYHAEIKSNPVAFDEPTALQAAQNFVNTTLGMPGDAVLTETDNLWNIDPTDGSMVQDGYEFVWQHSSPIYGGDGMKVIVTDNRTITRYCSEENDNEPPHNLPHCLAWTNQVNNDPYISYGYRLWRSVSSNRSYLSTGEAANGQQSIDAYTASLSLPQGFEITSYTQGYWSGNALDPASTSKGFVPAWIFFSGDMGIAIDAASGAVLGRV